MKKLVLGVAAALIATVALTSGAEAGGFKWHNHGWNHGWHNGWHHGFWGGPRFVIRPAYYGGDCFVRNVREYDEYGDLYIKHVRVCD